MNRKLLIEILIVGIILVGVRSASSIEGGLNYCMFEGYVKEKGTNNVTVENETAPLTYLDISVVNTTYCFLMNLNDTLIRAYLPNSPEFRAIDVNLYYVGVEAAFFPKDNASKCIQTIQINNTEFVQTNPRECIWVIESFYKSTPKQPAFESPLALAALLSLAYLIRRRA